MKTKRRKHSIMEAVHETACDLHEIGLIDDSKMQAYQALCQESVPNYSAEQILSLRQRYQLSRTALASLVNISPLTVKNWEKGKSCPAGPSQKLLQVLDRRGVDVFVQ